MSKTYELNVKLEGCNTNKVRVSANNCFEAKKVAQAIYGDKARIIGPASEVREKK